MSFPLHVQATSNVAGCAQESSLAHPMGGVKFDEEKLSKSRVTGEFFLTADNIHIAPQTMTVYKKYCIINIVQSKYRRERLFLFLDVVNSQLSQRLNPPLNCMISSGHAAT